MMKVQLDTPQFAGLLVIGAVVGLVLLRKGFRGAVSANVSV